jgi:sulfur carrier protein
VVTCPLADLKTVSDLIAELALDPRMVAIERNMAIVPRSAYASTPIMDGDAIEIVSFIGGG